MSFRKWGKCPEARQRARFTTESSLIKTQKKINSKITKILKLISLFFVKIYHFIFFSCLFLFFFLCFYFTSRRASYIIIIISKPPSDLFTFTWSGNQFARTWPPIGGFLTSIWTYFRFPGRLLKDRFYRFYSEKILKSAFPTAKSTFPRGVKNWSKKDPPFFIVFFNLLILFMLFCFVLFCSFLCFYSPPGARLIL